ncbi:GNAT family N-acetyltransferase [Romboutsia sp.]|uniref:GNAT family N-acetyltransferase n=1 Tax=Romboutsia sp. TaxID=1965302 RepID=UPI003F2E3D9B
MNYKVLTHDDYDDIVDISKKIWDGSDYLPSIFHKWVDDKEGCFLGIVHDEKIVAVGKYTILKDKQGWLEGLRVHVDYRGQKFAHSISDRLFDIACQDLKKGKITNIAMCTHKESTASINMMEAKNFKLEQSCLVAFKELSKLDKNIDSDDYNVEKWNISYNEFKDLDYFRYSNNKIIYGYTYYNLCKETYDELVKDNALIKINGHRCIVKMKPYPCIISIDNTFDSINDCVNYFLSKDRPNESEVYIAYPYKELVNNLRNHNYQSLINFEKDCLYYVYRE